MKQTSKLILLGFVLVFFALTVYFFKRSQPVQRTETATHAGVASISQAQLLSLKGKTIDGKPFALSDYKGKVILLNFWATWCPPCKAEIPSFMKLYDEQSDQVVIIGVSVDDTPQDVLDFLKRTPITYPIVMADDSFYAVFGTPDAVPTTFFISPSFHVVDQLTGIESETYFRQKILQLLDR